MRKTTATQSDELAARVKALTDKLESGVKDVFESDAYKSYLTAMSKLHRYSFGNVLLILWQCPEAMAAFLARSSFAVWARRTFVLSRPTLWNASKKSLETLKSCSALTGMKLSP